MVDAEMSAVNGLSRWHRGWHCHCDDVRQMTMNRQRPGADGPLLRRIHREYLEMPGLCLTLRQAQRLWDVDAETCADALALMIDSRFLACTLDGRYVRSPQALASLLAKSAA